MSKPSVLVTGASRGLGRTIAVAFAKHGYVVGVHYFQNEAESKTTEDLVMKAGGQASRLQADVRSSSQIDDMVKKFADQCGRIDVLVNNAGSVRNRTLFKMTDEEWKDAMAVNLDGPFFCTRAVLPIFRKQGGGSIVNITSFIAPRGSRGAGNYAAAKAGLITLTKTTALEEGINNIRANAVMPGFHVTDINREYWEKNQKMIREHHLLPQMADREEMAEFVVHIAELKSVTGQMFAFESRLL